MAVFLVAICGAWTGLAEARTAVDTGAVIAARTPPRGASPALVPLPRPRPADASSREYQPADTAQPADGAETKPEPAAAPPPPSACRLALTDAIAIAPSIPPIKGPGACGGDDLVRLEAVVLPDRSRVAVKPAAVLRCTMASAIADWIRSDMAPLAAGLATRLSELDNFDSFECRGRNRVANAKLSEHGRANALDVRGLKLANGQSLSLTARDVARDLREKVLGSVCGRFSTVLGPGSDGYHEDHIHLDLAERRNGYRICQWAVYEPMPEIAPLLPAPRPDDAPPREVASESDEPAPDRSAKEVEQLKVQPVAPPAVSLSPVPMAKQPADVAKRAGGKPAAAKPAATKSGAAKAAGNKPNAAQPEPAKPEEAESAAGPSPSNAAASDAAKPQSRTATLPPPTSLGPATSGKAVATAKSHAARPKSARKTSRKGQADLPVLLRRMFD